MLLFLKKTVVYTTCCALVLSGCQTTSSDNVVAVGLEEGPQLTETVETPDRKAVVDPEKPKLDVIIPVFDPGLNEEEQNYEADGVWPELRRAEANRFALKLKAALEDTGAFGAVRVAPDRSAAGDLYVIGKIVESNGEDVEIDIEVYDVSGARWFDRTFEHEVKTGFHKNPRNKYLDPYDPVFEKAANRVALELEDIDKVELAKLQRITELKFASTLSPEAFSEYLSKDKDEIELTSFPSDEDPMLRRSRAIRVRDQLFVDGLQETYVAFNEAMRDSYLIWQEQSLIEITAQREAENKATREAVLGAFLVGLGILAIVAGGRSNSNFGSTAATTGGIVATTSGSKLFFRSFHTSDEAKVHRDALEELGKSIDVDLAPRVVAFEKETVELSGTAKEQFSQWRAFLREIYAQEATPKVQL